MNRDLRPHQGRALAMLRESLMAGHRRPMLQAPTGFGKTLLAAAIVEGARAKGKRVIFTVPALSLIDQTFAAFFDEGIRDVGVMQGGHPFTDPSKPVQIASVQTLQRRQIPPADIVVVDEAHRWFAMYGSWMSDPSWQRVPFVGLSATPWTKGLGKHYDALLIAATTEDLIDEGYLAPFRVYAPSHPDLSKVHTVAGDYHEGELAEVMNEPVLVADVVSTWLEKGQDRPTLCFAVDRAHAKSLEEKFQDAGVSTAYIDAYTTRDERESIRKRFEKKHIQVVCNVGCLTTGVDWDVRCIVLARPTRSEMLFVQIVGRGLRTAADKDDLLILDHSDTHLRLGFVTDIRHERLDDGSPRPAAERETKEALPKECPSCSFLRPPKVQVCPACGFKVTKQPGIKCEDGELIEFDRHGNPLAAASKKADRETKQRWYSMLLGLAHERGYKSGWVANQYRQKFQVWPRGHIEVALPPSPEVRSYVKSRMIAFAKQRGAHHAPAA
jgi:superfamily II DNA or RNA helicase